MTKNQVCLSRRLVSRGVIACHLARPSPNCSNNVDVPQGAMGGHFGGVFRPPVVERPPISTSLGAVSYLNGSNLRHGRADILTHSDGRRQ